MRNEVCYMLRRELVGCQSCCAIDSRIDFVNNRLQFVLVVIKPFVLQVLLDDVPERLKIALHKCQFRCTVCGVNVSAFAFAELLGKSFDFDSFITPFFQWFIFGDHATKSF